MLGDARVEGVATAQERIHSAIVVLAAGAWSAQLSPEMRVEPVKGEMLLFGGSPFELPHIVLREGMYLIPRRDGAIVAGSTAETAGFDGAPSARDRQRILQAIGEFAPDIARRPIEAHWAGLRPASLDGLPRIGWSQKRPGLLFNCGHHRLGITLAPGSAQRLATLVTEKGTTADYGHSTVYRPASIVDDQTLGQKCVYPFVARPDPPTHRSPRGKR